ncbi:predicted protein [Plenodomus lingam JN3]|uniref:Predicted protein n=1 Tax=Leptosphaeria maculans (strain JN3 / isolate v23.1.3 / race Av1-4-5-6-7-8) TaxID=985895 RepID=E4ZNX3_LEPMJ|nr:predicted protein [Plenodomus lingam JN3]CBX93342.1 predicted protein [Plenodomus lingam JN3]
MQSHNNAPSRHPLTGQPPRQPLHPPPQKIILTRQTNQALPPPAIALPHPTPTPAPLFPRRRLAPLVQHRHLQRPVLIRTTRRPRPAMMAPAKRALQALDGFCETRRGSGAKGVYGVSAVSRVRVGWRASDSNASTIHSAQREMTVQPSG